ncbi:MAG: TRAP transporter small permease [Pseudomonadaceae bacterium]|jgi:TRAP-type C4-dicarboxylate transport system permease small subunit|uniref:TRAP transporter small permease protein n=1 Tax=Pseudomonas marincola TaxID=437900 RepID=A0A1I7CM10_9PSED|nr:MULTISPECIES: TRAP transporter small permease [Pseudomonas]MBQ55969.1 TRAP transporter small permease [Pseudomonadaceae bacterium]HCP56813.1 TRAP transporter small permease [Pseudomonas sp.]OEO25439.1 C4-dicarboxylate ABC transporter [Pseudomonas sp. J237]CAE6901155.1 TRAP transporter small permease [Pseudomonas marincola]SFU00424.1 TRAP-type C4-dicarboxylate transport system, small permease component [Pseudomonas marincola]
MKDTFLRVNDVIYTSCIWVAGLSVATMALIIPWGIFTRYALGSGSSWPEPVAILLMVLFTFIGAAASYRAGAHMAVSMATDRMPQHVQRYLEVLVQLLMATICLFMLIWGIKLCAATWNQFNPSLPSLRVGLCYSPIPLGGALTLIFIVERMVFGDQSHRKAVNYEQHEESSEALS